MGELELQVSKRIRSGQRVFGAGPALLVLLALGWARFRSERICDAPLDLCRFGSSAPWLGLLAVSALGLLAFVTWSRLLESRRSYRSLGWDEHAIWLLERGSPVTTIAWADAITTLERNEEDAVVSLEVRDDMGRAIVVRSDARRVHRRDDLVASSLAELASVAARARIVREGAEESTEFSPLWSVGFTVYVLVGTHIMNACPAVLTGIAFSMWILRAPLWLYRERRRSPGAVPTREAGGPYRGRPNASAPTMSQPSTRWAIADAAIAILALVTLLLLD